MTNELARVAHCLQGATSTETGIGGGVSTKSAKKLTLIIRRSGHVSGAGTFKVQFSPVNPAEDNESWADYNKLVDNVTNTNVQQLTRVASKALGSNTMTELSIEDALPWVRVVLTESGEGVSDAWLLIQP